MTASRFVGFLLSSAIHHSRGVGFVRPYSSNVAVAAPSAALFVSFDHRAPDDPRTRLDLSPVPRELRLRAAL